MSYTLVFLLLLSFGIGAETNSLSMTSELVSTTNGLALSLSLRSRVNQFIGVSYSQLPWGHCESFGMHILAVDHGGRFVPARLMMYSPAPGGESIEPGKAIEGQVMLNDRFEHVQKPLLTSDLLVYWTYFLDNREGAPLCRSSGCEYVGKGGVVNDKWKSSSLIQMKAKPVWRTNNLHLDCQLHWNGQWVLKLNARQVPWLNPRSASLTVLHPSVGGFAVDQAPRVQSKDRRPITIAAGESARGNINLSKEFPHIKTAMGLGMDLAVLWHVNLKTGSNQARHQSFGWTELPAKNLLESLE